MNKLVLIDGNSILNRAFYGIMGNKMLMTKDGKYTNAIYGFLAIMFKVIEDLKPQYLVITFDLKAPTKRHILYDGYKATRKGMPNELAEQMPILKEILRDMNITIIEKEGYEADDIIGTLSKYGDEQGVEVTILSGDRDNFQLARDNVIIRIPRTKNGKTEIDNFDRNKIKETYGIEPKQLIEVKALQGDASDNIPGVPGIGEKTALSLIQKYENIENLYERLEKNETDLKGKVKENLTNNKELANLSKTLGTIDLDVPIEKNLEEFKILEWDKEKVLEKFKELNFNRYIERFNLGQINKEEKNVEQLFNIIEENKDIFNIVKENNELIYYFEKIENNELNLIIQKEIKNISIYNKNDNTVYYTKINNDNINCIKELFEDKKIKKYGYKLSEDYILLKQIGINFNNYVYDAEIAAYDINSNSNKYPLEDLAKEYLDLDVNQYLNKIGEQTEKQSQINLFDEIDKNEIKSDKYKNALNAYIIGNIYPFTIEKLKKYNQLDLFQTIEMPLVEVLSQMQYEGIYVDKQKLSHFGNELKKSLNIITKEIYNLSGEEFNIKSPKQLGEVLFEKLKLPVVKKTKSGYSTDVDVLEKIKKEHPVIEKILEYRSLSKLNSTYVEGLLPYINNQTNRIHSYFHQTITTTGRISSTEPNLQNIPTRLELGKRLRKVFEPAKDYVYIDADYSQIELRVLAHISKDENMIQAFLNDEDIHKQAAAKVLNISIDDVTKEQRSQAKAVNFGIVYGISDFGLSEQIGVSKKKAKEYIEQYLEKYNGIKIFMDDIVEKAKEQGYVETLFNRRRYIPELNSNNYMVRQLGARMAMNTPIQGTAADIMKIAMIKVYYEIKKRKLKSKLILQIHDELLIETYEKETEEVKKILQNSMESAINLIIPLKVEMSEGNNWYETK